MYRVIYWFNGEQRFSAKTNKQDAENTAKHFGGTVVKEVKKYDEQYGGGYGYRKKIMKSKLEQKLIEAEKNNG